MSIRILYSNLLFSTVEPLPGNVSLLIRSNESNQVGLSMMPYFNLNICNENIFRVLLEGGMHAHSMFSVIVKLKKFIVDL